MIKRRHYYIVTEQNGKQEQSKTAAKLNTGAQNHHQLINDPRQVEEINPVHKL